MTKNIIGIDLGTTNSSVAVYKDGKPIVIPNSYGSIITPSVVSIDKDGHFIVGEKAKQEQILNPTNTIFSVKRLMGYSCKNVFSRETYVPYKIVRGSDNEPVRLTINGRNYMPQEISALIIRELKQIAENYLEETIEQAVITVPAYFNDAQRQATKDAGSIAGLKVLRIINEPTAAALSYKNIQNGGLAILHFGGGTFDISFVDKGMDVFEVICTYGDNLLGGDDFDNMLYRYILDKIQDKYNYSIDDTQVLSYIKKVSEEAKCELSSRKETTIHLQGLINNKFESFELEIQRDVFEGLSFELFERIRNTIRRAKMDSSGFVAGDVLLVGGSSLIPYYRKLVEAELGTHAKLHPSYLDAVALGAAIEGGILSNQDLNSLLLDVTPFSVGIESLGGVMTKLIYRNETIPTERKKVFSTSSDNETSVEIHVLQGEREFARDNQSLGKFQIEIPSAPRGVRQIEVTLEIDANGILDVSAKELSTGEMKKINIKSVFSLNDTEIISLSRNIGINPYIDSQTNHETVVEKTTKTDKNKLWMFFRKLFGQC